METEQLQAAGQHKLHLDEQVEWLWEQDAVSPPPGVGRHRYQHIQLVREGKMRHFVADMGPSNPLLTQFNFWAAGLYSVGECLEQAEYLREGKPPQEHEPLDLALSYLNLMEEKQRRRFHQSTFGPGGWKVR